MKKSAALFLGVVLLFSVVLSVTAQEPAPAPKPGPEHEKLGFFVGKWHSEGDIKASAFGPAGKYTFTETSEWLPGKFAVLCHSEGYMMGGDYRGLSVMSFDTADSSYVYFETNNWGENVYSHGAVQGDTWTWSNESKMNGQPVRTRFILKQASADSATYSFAMAMGTSELTTIMEGKQTRQK